jgi:site-specific DNA recombinase
MVKNLNYKIALYIRVSTEEQAENPEGSVKNQEQRLREAVAYRNRNSNFGEIAGVFTDAGISAKDMRRPQLQAMLTAIRNGEVNLVMVTELSRLSRNNRDFLGMWDMMHERGCRFMSLREDFDTTTAAGEMLLFQLVNFAQFERKQTSERVGANIAARAVRGLYNGGSIAVGYKRMPDKPGFLRVDDEAAVTVRTAFSAFLREGCLAHAAKWLNENGYSVSKHLEGGGRRMRVGHFTVDNLCKMLKNKAYIGVKVYRHKDEWMEARAVWEPIIDEVTFARVREKLTKNRSKMKPKSFYKLPYLLSGLNFCMKCGSHMPGKSATGNAGKVGYYEHAWATKRDSTLTKKLFKCDPHRVPQKRLEPLVWRELVKFVTNTDFMKTMLAEVRVKHDGNPGQREKERLKAKLYGVNSQIDAVAERLTQLPKSVSAAPIFKQLEKLESAKREIEEGLTKVEILPGGEERLVKVKTFEEFAEHYRKLIDRADHETRKSMVQKFVKKIEVGVDSVKIHWIMDQEHYERELALRGRSPIFKNNGSYSLTFGAR